jgi:hypothetical protein
MLGNIHLDDSIEAHTPINRELLTKAQGVSQALKAMQQNTLGFG